MKILTLHHIMEQSFLEKRCTRCGLTETVEMISKNKTFTL